MKMIEIARKKKDEKMLLRVATIRKQRDVKCGEAVRIAKEVELLITLMRHEVVGFTFMKQNGDPCHVRGTLKDYWNAFKYYYFAKANNRFVVYYDLDAKAWRTFQAAFLMRID
ncbi:SH3 beta-barrel fold-containing protein [uncultured Bacteroides sp.]|uniref:SH3 beta-barrel fold-containing protein n=1 Tax=uncultured Bacteroides sp. TaxID=162156 RepID=UPI002AAC13B8|nr:SH3 beta-barrel fold-containing protein [uncultured Bacteroides sp.]